MPDRTCATDLDKLLTLGSDRARSRGQSLTPLRAQVLTAMAQQARPLGAYDLQRILGNQRRVSPVSIYRCLEFLMDIGLVHRLATQSAYVLLKRPPAENETLLCLVCRSCGEVDEVSAPVVGQTLGSALAAASFTPASRLMEVEGDCSDCRRRHSLSHSR